MMWVIDYHSYIEVLALSTSLGYLIAMVSTPGRAAIAFIEMWYWSPTAPVSVV
jgi:hypothetical protein